MKTKFINCTHCGEPINHLANQCPHCGNYMRSWRRVLADIRTIVEVLAFVATSAAIWFLYDTSKLTRDQLDLQKSIREDDLKHGLVSDSVNRIQIDLFRKQISQLERNAELTRLGLAASDKEAQFNRTKTIAEKKPVVCPSQLQAAATGDSVALSITLLNSGSSVASNVRFHLKIRPDHNQADSSQGNFTIPIIVGGSSYSQPIGLHKHLARRSLVICTNVRWQWVDFDLTDSCTSNFLVLFDSTSGLYSVGALTLEQAKQH